MRIKYLLLLVATIGSSALRQTKSVLQINEADFSQKTNIKIIQQNGSFISTKNTFFYFFIQGQQTQQKFKNNIKQFQQMGMSYLKSKQQKIIITENIQEQLSNDPKNQNTLQGPQQINKNAQSTDLQTSINEINFFIVKCPKNPSNYDQKPLICQNTGIYEKPYGSNVFLFTTHSEIIKYNEEINENNLFLFISKVQENSQFFETTINFDTQLEKMAIKVELKNISIKNKALSILEKIKSYLSWEMLKFLVIFGVLPFLFGYLSSKSQQKANKKRMGKYGVIQQNTDGKKIQGQKQLKKQ